MYIINLKQILNINDVPPPRLRPRDDRSDVEAATGATDLRDAADDRRLPDVVGMRLMRLNALGYKNRSYLIV